MYLSPFLSFKESILMKLIKLKYLLIITPLVVTSLTTQLVAQNLASWRQPIEIPQPKDNLITPQKVALGKILFFDPRLSKSDKTSCASCHDPKLGWSDGKPIAIGDENKVGRRNSPTVVNSAYLRSFFHDARASSLEEQASGPIESEVEMNMPMDVLVKKLQAIEGYRELFKEAFGDEGITKENIVKAIASFERVLITPKAPFDKWVDGDENAIDDEAKIGYSIFMNEGKCRSCHVGFNFTNEKMINIGLGDEKDLGMYEIAEKKSTIWYATFKTPTLRNIEKTAPYFHNGSVETLYEAVKICGNGGKKPVKSRSPFFRDRRLSDEEVSFVMAFLKTLTSPDIKVEIPTVFPQ